MHITRADLPARAFVLGRTPPLNFVKHISALAERELVVKPVAQTAGTRSADQLIPNDLRVIKLQSEIMVRAQQPNSNRGRSCLASLSLCQLADRNGVQPSIVRAPVILGIKIPVRSSQLQSRRRKRRFVLLQVFAVATRGGDNVVFSLCTKVERH